MFPQTNDMGAQLRFVLQNLGVLANRGVITAGWREEVNFWLDRAAEDLHQLHQ